MYAANLLYCIKRYVFGYAEIVVFRAVMKPGKVFYRPERNGGLTARYLREYERVIEQLVSHFLAQYLGTVTSVMYDPGDIVKRVIVVPVLQIPPEDLRNRKPVRHSSLVDLYPELYVSKLEIYPHVLVQHVQAVDLVVAACRRNSQYLYEIRFARHVSSLFLALYRLDEAVQLGSDYRQVLVDSLYLLAQVVEKYVAVVVV